MLKILPEAFLLAALEYIDKTHFGYHLEFDIDEAIDIAFAHAFLRRKR